MSRLASDEALAAIFKMEPKMVDIDQLPRLERYFSENEPEWLDTLYEQTCRRLAITKLQAVALIDVLRSLPTEYVGRPAAVALVKDCQDILDDKPLQFH